jgi:hypothetical protein
MGILMELDPNLDPLLVDLEHHLVAVVELEHGEMVLLVVVVVDLLAYSLTEQMLLLVQAAVAAAVGLAVDITALVQLMDVMLVEMPLSPQQI